MELLFILVSGGILVLIFGYFYYDEHIKKFMPNELGIEDFQRVAKHESSEWRDNAYKYGLTKAQWSHTLRTNSCLSRIY